MIISGSKWAIDRLGKKLARADLLIAPFHVTEPSPTVPIDTLYIFDCCFGYLTTRSITPGETMKGFHCIRCQKCALFTWKLLIEIKSRVQKGEKEVEIDCQCYWESPIRGKIAGICSQGWHRIDCHRRSSGKSGDGSEPTKTRHLVNIHDSCNAIFRPGWGEGNCGLDPQFSEHKANVAEAWKI